MKLSMLKELCTVYPAYKGLGYKGDPDLKDGYCLHRQLLWVYNAIRPTNKGLFNKGIPDLRDIILQHS